MDGLRFYGDKRSSRSPKKCFKISDISYFATGQLPITDFAHKTAVIGDAGVAAGVVLAALGTRPDPDAYGQAFTLALACNVALLALGGVLSLWLPGERRAADMPQPVRKAS